MEQVSSKEKNYWSGIIEVVTTPLAFFALIVLVIEAGFGVFAINADTYNKTILISGMLGLLALLIISVIYLSYRRPEALFGRRYEEESFVFKIFGQKIYITSNKLKDIENSINKSAMYFINDEFKLGILPYAYFNQIQNFVMKFKIYHEVFNFDYLKINNSRIMHLLGSYYFLMDNSELSKRCYQKAWKLNNKDPIALNCLGIIYLREDQYPLALHHFKKLQTTSKGKGWGYLGEGITLEKMGKSDLFRKPVEKAIKEFTGAVINNNKDFLSFFGLALALRKIGELKLSEKCYNRVIAIKPDLAPAYYNRMTVKIKQKQNIENIVSDLRNAIRYHPEMLRAAKGDPDLSTLSHEKCIKCLVG